MTYTRVPIARENGTECTDNAAILPSGEESKELVVDERVVLLSEGEVMAVLRKGVAVADVRTTYDVGRNVGVRVAVTHYFVRISGVSNR